MDDRPARLDVDARFLLANERTLLAWVRTGLTLIAVGTGLAQFGEDVTGHRVVAALLTGVGVLAVLVGGVRHATADRVIRGGGLPPTGRAPYVLVAAVAAVGAALLVALVVGA